MLLRGQGIDLGANLTACQPKDSPWPHPVVAVDAHTIVTEAILCELPVAVVPELASPPMELLLKKLASRLTLP